MKRLAFDWTLWLKIALAAGALGYLVHVVEPGAIAEAAAGAHVGWIAAAAALLPLNLALQSIVWYLLLQRVAPGVRRRAAVGSVLSGHTLGLVTPANAGEFVGRAFYVPGTDRWEVSAAVLVQRLVEMTASIDVGAAALFYYLHVFAPEPISFWKGLAWSGAGLAVIMTGFALRPGLAYRVVARVVRRRQVLARVDFLQRLPSVSATAILGLCFAGYAIYSTQFYFLLRAFAPGADVLSGYLGIALVYFVKFIIPAVTFLDLGIREGAAVYFLGGLGFAEAAALNASLLLFTTNLLLPALAGLPLVFRLRFRDERAGRTPRPARPDASNRA